MAGTAHPRAYSNDGLAVPFPHEDDDERVDQEPDDQDSDDQDADDDDDAGDGDDGGQGGGGRRPVTFSGGGVTGAGAGWVLGVLLWGWVVLPFVKGGPAGVKATLRAKFLNQAKDGSPLP